MKRYFLIFATAFCCFCASAQDNETSKISIECSIGFIPTETPALVFYQLDIDDFYSNPIVDIEKPTLNLSMYYQTFKRISFGASITYAHKGSETYTKNRYGDVDYEKEAQSALACMFGIKVDIMQHDLATLYSGVEIGFATDINYPACKCNLLATQFTMLGLKFGKKLYGKAELGFGTKGILQFGLGYRF